MDPVQKGAFLTTLARDSAGNTLAIATASIFAIMGVVGGAVDISRSYMAQSRLQQACDAGALAARKAMTGESLTEANKQTGYNYFDFNFPEGSYGVELTSRTYAQPANSAGTPQAIVDGTVIATVPTTIMRIFGKETVDIAVRCSSKMDIQNADVAMVLDVTGSMDGMMDVNDDGTLQESRLSALRKAVRAFYNALGPGRAGGDASKGRIRYAFIPYGTVVNVGTLLSHDQMVDRWTYQSREAKSGTSYYYTLSAMGPTTVTTTPSGPSDAYSSDGAYNTTYTVVSGNNSDEFTMQDGSKYKKKLTTPSNINSAGCTAANQYGTADKLVGVTQTEGNWSSNNTNPVATDNNPPVHPATTQNMSSPTRTRTATVTYGYRYRWQTVSGNTGCYLERASKRTSGTPGATYTQSQTTTATKTITWTAVNGVQLVYGPREFDVSGLKASGGGWNSSVTLPGLNMNGGTNYNYTWSGSSTAFTKKIAGTAQNGSATWRGCVEERQIDNTITSASSVSTVPSNAYDLDVTRMASTGDDATRWKPYLYAAVFAVDGSSPVTNSEECPSPALRLQEIGDYDKTIITSPYPNLFRNASGNPTSYYYPYTSSRWPDPSSDPVNNPTPIAELSKNTATTRNYIDRIQTVSGTLHDVGFAWGLHLVSGEGMFEADNPDRFNTAVVSRHIVFMTDGEMNPGEERYVFSGYNQRDGRLAPASTSNSQMIAIQNRRLRILCEAAKAQKITVWVVAITDSTTTDYTDLAACASAPGNFKTAATSTELINSFTTIAQSIGGLRISR